MNKHERLLPKKRFSIYSDYWQISKMKDIFPVIRSGNRLPKDNIKKGDIPYIIATVSNNGIYKSIDKNTLDYHGNRMKLFLTPSITFSIDNPEAIFLQENDFFTSNIMRVLNNETLKAESYSFFLELLRKETDGFDWSIKFSGPVVLNLEIVIPNSDEEINRIGNLFKTMDNLINLQQQRITKLKDLKSAYLVDMFPKEGEKHPKRRFAEFTNDFETVKFGEILKSIPFSLYITKPMNTGKYEVVQQGNNSVVGYANGKPFLNYQNVILFGDHTLSLYKPTKPFFIATDGVKIIEGKKRIDRNYLLYLLENYMVAPEGYKRYFLILKNNNCVLTKCIKEQKKIGEFFQKLDNQIRVNEDKLEKLKQLKQAYLNDMFG